MLDKNNKPIKEGCYIKYSFYDIGIPTFYGRVFAIGDELHIEHSNKVTIKIDERIRFIEIIRYES